MLRVLPSRQPPARFWVAALTLLGAVGCGDEVSVGTPAVGPAPHRTAIQDRALRTLVMDVAARRACPELMARFVPLPEDRPGRARTELPTVDGRLRVDSCSVERDDDRLRVQLAGEGWQWVSRQAAGPLGSSFTVRGVVRFEASLSLVGEVDVAYDEASHRASIVLSPVATPSASVTPIGALPIAPDGGWSDLIGGLGGLLGSTPESSARPMLEAEAAATLSRELGDGLTLGFDLCTSQVDATLGAVGDGETPPVRPYEAEGDRWLDNYRAWARRGAFDLEGPFSGADALRVDVEAEQGGPLSVRVVCDGEASRVANALITAGAPGAITAARVHTVPAQGELSFEVDAGTCNKVHLLFSGPVDADVRYRARVRRSGQAVDPWVDCER